MEISVNFAKQICEQNNRKMKKILILALAAFFGMQAQAQTLKQKVNVSDVKAVATTKAENYAEITAFRLYFYHPRTGEQMKFETPHPTSFTRLFTNLNTNPINKEEDEEV